MNLAIFLKTRYNIKLKQCGELYRGFCPFHEETKPSFFVYPKTDSFFCFSCKRGGSGQMFVAEYENIPMSEAKKVYTSVIKNITLKELKEQEWDKFIRITLAELSREFFAKKKNIKYITNVVEELSRIEFFDFDKLYKRNIHNNLIRDFQMFLKDLDKQPVSIKLV